MRIHKEKQDKQGNQIMSLRDFIQNEKVSKKHIK